MISHKKEEDKMKDEMIAKQIAHEIVDYRPKSTAMEMIIRKSNHLVKWVMDNEAWAPNGAVAVKYCKHKNNAKNHVQSFTQTRLNEFTSKSITKHHKERQNTIRQLKTANPAPRKTPKKPEARHLEIYLSPFCCIDWIHANTLGIEKQLISVWQEIEKAQSEDTHQVGVYWAICNRQIPSLAHYATLGHAMNCVWFWTVLLPAWYAMNSHLLEQNDDKTYKNNNLVDTIKYISMCT